MAHDTRRLRRYNSITLSGNRLVHAFTYATDNTKAELLTDGYFNDSRMALTVGSRIEALCDADGTPNWVDVRVATVPATGNVTVALDIPDAT